MTELKIRSYLYLMAQDYDYGGAPDRWVGIKENTLGISMLPD